MFFLMRYQTVVATRREINLARQFCRVSLVHRMEANVARQPFEVIRFAACIHFLVGRFLSPRVRRCKETKLLTVRPRVVPASPALRRDLDGLYLVCSTARDGSRLL